MDRISAALERIDSERTGDVWIGTYAAPGGRVAVVTEEAPTQARALAAARRWVEAGPLETPAGHQYLWVASERYSDRYDVFLMTERGTRRVPVEKA